MIEEKSGDVATLPGKWLPRPHLGARPGCGLLARVWFVMRPNPWCPAGQSSVGLPLTGEAEGVQCFVNQAAFRGEGPKSFVDHVPHLHC